MIRLFNRHYPVRNVFFVIGEGALIFASILAAASVFRFWASVPSGFSFFMETVLVTLICQVFLFYHGMYDINALNSMADHAARLLQALGFTTVILGGIHLWIGHEIIPSKIFITGLVTMAVLVLVWRFIYSQALSRHFLDKTVLILGDSPLIRSIIRSASAQRDCGFALTHLISTAATGPGSIADGENGFSGIQGLSSYCREHAIRMIVADDAMDGWDETIENELLACRTDGIRVMDAQAFFEMLTGKLHAEKLKAGWIIFSGGFHRSVLHHAFKLLFDYAVSGFLLFLLSPGILLTAVLIKLDSSGPVFYSQERLGKNKKPYKIYKFRSMVVDAEKNGGPAWSKSGDTRVTRIGNFIRNWRIDEIPQLVNVLKGDMSFVGPRPERDFFVKRLERDIPFYGVRFTVKPGITGWAQINYGYGSTDEDALEKLNYDLYYIKNSTVFMDLFIVFRTTRTVILGVEHGNGETAVRNAAH